MEIWGKWVGPYVVLSRIGVNYKLRSKTGKTFVSHHDQVKSCPVPASEGQPYCPVPEIPDVYALEEPAVENARMIRPPNLHQVLNPQSGLASMSHIEPFRNLIKRGMVCSVFTIKMLCHL